jgi:phosphoenolpyruvate carboxykinase (ATP)
MSIDARRDVEQLLARPKRVHRNLRSAVLVEHSIRRGEGHMANNGALVTQTGKRTGRSPNDKFTVKNARTDDVVAWGNVNRPFDPDKFEALYRRVIQYLQDKEIFVQDLFAGADPEYRLPIQVVNELAWHNLFVRALFVRPKPEELPNHKPEFTVIAVPHFLAEPSRDGTNSEAFIIVDFTSKVVLIGGTLYAGEMKKSIFGVMNFILPERNVFPMHCSANMGLDGDTALFFGLSGTGKTTLSADPKRRLIGDDGGHLQLRRRLLCQVHPALEGARAPDLERAALRLGAGERDPRSGDARAQLRR